MNNNNYLSIAKLDLKSAKHLIDINPQIVPSLCTQAIEKELKHYITEYIYIEGDDLRIMKGHNLKKLARATDIKSIDEYIVDLTDLTDYYFDTRYPGESFIEISYDEAKRIYEKTEEIFNLILKGINDKEKELKLLDTNFGDKN